MESLEQRAKANQAALTALRENLAKFVAKLPAVGPVVSDTRAELQRALGVVDELGRLSTTEEHEGTSEGQAAAESSCRSCGSRLRESARALRQLRPRHQKLRSLLAAPLPEALRQTAAGPGKAKQVVDFSPFVKARWEAERRKGQRMLGQGDDEDSHIKVWIEEMPKPSPEEKPSTQVKGRHIVVNTGEKIRKVYSELLQTGAVDRVGFIRGASATKFNALAQERSDCPTGKRGGDMGWISKGKAESKFQEVAFATPKGACSPPFKSQNGYHVFLCEDRKV